MRAFAFSLTALAACYSPTLGNDPFFCGSAAPACPDGYTCQMNTQTMKMVCVSSSGGSPTDGAGSGSFQCDDDGTFEGTSKNDTISTAFDTPVAIQRSSVTFAGLAICPATDKDYYRVDFAASTTTLSATVVYDDPTVAGAGPLQMTIDNNTGAAVATATLVTGMPNTISATVSMQPMASSPYYIQVQGDGVHQNNYKLTINATSP